MVLLFAVKVLNRINGLNNPYRFVDPDGKFAVTTEIDEIKKEAHVVSQESVRDVKNVVNMAVAVASEGMVQRGITAKGGGTFERVVNNAELKATQQTGLLRGGREGENFFTNSASLDAKRSQQRLGLDGPLRDARIQFSIKNDIEVTGPRPAAPGQTGTAGGGREFSTTGRTEIEIYRVDRLRK